MSETNLRVLGPYPLKLSHNPAYTPGVLTTPVSIPNNVDGAVPTAKSADESVAIATVEYRSAWSDWLLTITAVGDGATKVIITAGDAADIEIDVTVDHNPEPVAVIDPARIQIAPPVPRAS